MLRSCRRRERRVGRIEIAFEHAADQRECQALPAQFSDAREALNVLRPVPSNAALAFGRGEQPPLLVEADRVDRDVGPAGNVFDPEALWRRLRPHEY
jgi:hypothetical protein